MCLGLARGAESLEDGAVRRDGVTRRLCDRCVRLGVVGHRRVDDGAALGADHVAMRVETKVEPVAAGCLDAGDGMRLLEQAQVTVDRGAADLVVAGAHVEVDLLGGRMVATVADRVEDEGSLFGVPALNRHDAPPLS